MLKAKLLKDGLLPFDKKKDDYERLVEREMKGEVLSDEQYQSLHGNLDKWRDHLHRKLINIDGQMTIRKCGFHLNGDPIEETEQHFQEWRRSASFFKKRVSEKLSEVKLMIENRKEDQKVEEREEHSREAVPSVLEELRKIRILLEQRLPVRLVDQLIQKRMERI